MGSPLGSDTGLTTNVRDAHLDNLKFVLITLVVIGHVVEVIHAESPLAGTLYRAIYLFHMPAFVLVTGHLSSASVNPDRGVKYLRTLVVPYLVFQVLYLVFAGSVGPEPVPLSLFRPYWLMWFLMAVIIWRLLTPLLLALRAPMAWAIAISLGAPLLPDATRFLALNRTLGLLPFFVAGLLLPPGSLGALRRRRWAVAAGIAGLACIAVAALMTPDIDRAALFYTYRYDDAGGIVRGAAVRTAVLALGAIGTIAVASLVAVRRRWWTAFGAGSISAYLVHGFLVRGARWNGWLDEMTDPVEVIGLVVLAAGSTIALCAPPVVRVLRPLTSPALTWALRPSSTTQQQIEGDRV